MELQLATCLKIAISKVCSLFLRLHRVIQLEGEGTYNAIQLEGEGTHNAILVLLQQGFHVICLRGHYN